MVTVPFPEPDYYYAYLDEETFFEWLLHLPVVSRIGDSDKESSIHDDEIPYRMSICAAYARRRG